MIPNEKVKTSDGITMIVFQTLRVLFALTFFYRRAQLLEVELKMFVCTYFFVTFI